MFKHIILHLGIFLKKVTEGLARLMRKRQGAARGNFFRLALPRHAFEALSLLAIRPGGDYASRAVGRDILWQAHELLMRLYEHLE